MVLNFVSPRVCGPETAASKVISPVCSGCQYVTVCLCHSREPTYRPTDRPTDQYALLCLSCALLCHVTDQRWRKCVSTYCVIHTFGVWFRVEERHEEFVRIYCLHPQGTT